MNACKSRFAIVALALIACTLNLHADDFAVDAVHSGATFKALHFGLTWIPGRFNDVAGKLSVDTKDPTKTTFDLTAKVDSIDTNNAKRDEHLKAADFFDAKQFPTITFKSKSAKKVDAGLEVTGDMTMHGVTKPVTITFKGGKVSQSEKMGTRIGYTADFTVKRSDFGMGKMLEALGDEVHVGFAIEGVKK